ncbi:MAG: hypothetical protein K8J08_07565 [Thermoanaerobaculia bacterium]|nr:hypothetical protein [Thermoanaerobaculia bacterium]
MIAGTTGTTQLLTAQGGGAVRANGNFVSNSATGLGTYYSYYVEVPPSASRLVIDIFDADIGIGGNTERDLNRDEIRSTADTAATYVVRNPLGAVQPVRFSTGDSTGPSGSDNAWLTLFDTASPAYVSFATAVQGSNVTSISVPIPGAPCAIGDFLVAAIATDGARTISAPGSSWTQINQGSNGSDVTLALFRRTAAAVGVSQTFSWTGTEQAAAGILCYRGVDATTPVGVSGAANGTSATPTAPSVTTTVANTQILRFYAADDDDLAASPYPTGHTGRFNLESSASGGTVSLGAAGAAQGAAGATGSAAFTLSESEQWRAATVALRGSNVTLMAGHWEVRVNHGSSSGDDVNAFGIRAHDGTPGAGGTELNVYAESFQTYGTNNQNVATLSRSYTHHPYVTSGCQLTEWDFDWDGQNTGDQGSLTFSHRGGVLFQSVPDPLSANDAWASHTVSGWRTVPVALNSTNYGIWSMGVTIIGYGGTGSSGNYGQIVLRDDQSPVSAPAAQPTSGSFDIYIPTDTGVAPTKPYLEQQARYKSGPNPPLVGQTTRMTVTVRFANPTAHAVTFNTSNVVTSNVPGITVVYAGNPQVSQGSILTQPVVGGTGNITWNPGTVAAGATVILAYEVNVTPALIGQTLPITGSPALNGTRATYVDETCTGASPACTGAQLTRATPTLGPLCQLSVTQNAATYVKISRFDSYESRDGLVVEWESASESGTMGYELWRSSGGEWNPVRGGEVPALFGAPQGGIYRVVDPDGAVGDDYIVVERDLRGATSTHGPYSAHPERSLDVQMESMVTAEALRAELSRSPRSTQGLSGPRPDRGGPAGRERAPLATKLIVREAGLYYVSSVNLAGALGKPVAWIETQITRGGISLANGGQSVAWAPATGSRGIYFYAEAIDSLYTRDNVYVLSATPGSRMTTFPWVSASPSPEASYAAIDRHEVDSLAALVLGLDPESDYWFWAGLTAGNASFDTWTTTIQASSLGSGAAELSVSVLGSTFTGAGGSHEVDLFLNGNYLTTENWTGGEHTVTASFSTADLSEGANTVSLRALIPSGGTQNFVFVDHVELTYDRRYVASGDSLAFGADGNTAITLDGFSGSVILLDVTDPRHPQLATGAVTGTFQPPSPAGRYLAVGPTAVREVMTMQPMSNRNLLASPAEDIFLVPTTIEHSVDELMGYRQSQGLDVERVTLGEVMDQFNHGIFDPRAIRSYLIAAERQWGSAPRYLTLVGSGHYDYRDIYGVGGQLMPPLLVATSNGLYASDDAYGDLDGDGLADISVGRIPATDYDDMWNYSQKVIAYEAAESTADVLLISDSQRPGEGLDFSAESSFLASGLSSVANVTQLDLGPLDIETLRQAMFEEMAAGPAFVNYFGHGAADVWSDHNILTLSDVSTLTGPASIYTGLTCLMNRFEVTGFETLGARLLFAPGGAAAVWSPTSPEHHLASKAVGELFYQRIQNHDWNTPLVLGDLVRQVKETTSSELVDSLGTFLLMGDPALRLRFEPPVGTPPTPGEGE